MASLEGKRINIKLRPMKFAKNPGGPAPKQNLSLSGKTTMTGGWPIKSKEK